MNEPEYQLLPDGTIIQRLQPPLAPITTASEVLCRQSCYYCGGKLVGYSNGVACTRCGAVYK